MGLKNGVLLDMMPDDHIKIGIVMIRMHIMRGAGYWDSLMYYIAEGYISFTH